MGNIQTTGKVMPEMLAAALEQPMQGRSFDEMAAHSTDWWFMTEDLPGPNNRISWHNDTIKISYTENNRASFDRFRARWAEILKHIDACDYIALDIKVDINNVTHQCGT